MCAGCRRILSAIRQERGHQNYDLPIERQARGARGKIINTHRAEDDDAQTSSTLNSFTFTCPWHMPALPPLRRARGCEIALRSADVPMERTVFCTGQLVRMRSGRLEARRREGSLQEHFTHHKHCSHTSSRTRRDPERLRRMCDHTYAYAYAYVHKQNLGRHCGVFLGPPECLSHLQHDSLYFIHQLH